ncbi:MAG: hypothetical protein Q9211_005162 [Gyalolechia sp. 1 TL-2023]
MAEVFSTVAGVASLIDVALRACNVLYDSIRYLKDESELSQRLRRTVQSVESVLQSLDEFVALYRQQQSSASLPNFLPDAVNHEIISIKAELHALSTLLPSSSSSSRLRRGLKWVLDRKKVAEVIQSLDSHQITLIFALQSFAQRNGISVHEDISRRLDQILRQHESTARNLNQELDSFRTGLHAELEVVTQTYRQSLPAQENLKTRLENLHELVSAGQNVANDKFDAIGASLSHVQSSIVVAAPTEDVLARIFRAELRRVIIPAVEQCFQQSKANPDSQLDEIRRKFDEMTQQLGSKSGGDVHDNVVPTNNPLQEVSSAHTHDRQEAADLAASLPWDSKVMIFAGTNNVEGIQDLFERRLAAPSDRDEEGTTPLMYAAYVGATEACRLLLSEGSDPLATDERGWNPFDWTNVAVTSKALNENSIDKHYEIVKLLQQADSDFMEVVASTTTWQTLPMWFNIDQDEEATIEKNMTLAIAYIQRLKELGLRLEDYDDGFALVVQWLVVVDLSTLRFSREAIRTMLRTVLSLDADLCTADGYGFAPLHTLFFFRDDRTENRLHNSFEMATALLQNGADPYALTVLGTSTFDLAEKYGFTSIFLEALEEAGYDIKEVQSEIEWRQWCFENPDHGFGESTAVDDTRIAPPSTEGLVSRRGVRGDRLED